MTAKPNRERRGPMYDRLTFAAGGSGEADWMEVDPECVMRAIDAASAQGGALRFGYTRDGGAYAIGIYGDGDPYTVYCKPAEDIRALLGSITSGFEDMGRAPRNGNGKAAK